jgi:D-alanyl-D-alanine dipeptidase
MSGKVPSMEELVRRARAHGLVLLCDAVPGLASELRYARADNFSGSALYPEGMPVLLQEDVAAALGRARSAVRAGGYDLLVWDAWRPAEASQLLWDRIRDPRFAAEPGRNGRWSWHCYGRAVDVTLCDAAGRAMAMPSDFDDFTAAAAADYAGGDPGVAARLRLLQEAMRSAGFRTLDAEWWHFSMPVDSVPAVPVTAADIGIALPG